MAYVGNTPTTQSFISGTDYFNGTGAQTAFTLSRTVNSVNDIQVTVNNVVQQPNDAYTLSGTTLTMTSAPSAGTNNVYVRYLSTTTQAITPSQGTVSWSTLDSNIQQDLGISFKNKIINGAMAISQRTAVNTNVAVATSSQGTFGPDRFWGYTGTGSLWNISQVSTSALDFPQALRVQRIAGQTSTSDIYCGQTIETANCVGLAGQNVTVSFYATAGANYSGGSVTVQILTGTAADQGTSSLNTAAWTGLALPINTTFTPTTTRTRFTFTGAIGSTVQEIAFRFNWAGSGTAGANDYLDITGVQLEVGTQATAFSTAGGSYGAEFALCQRYCWVTNSDSLTIFIGAGTTSSWGNVVFPVAMRAAPTPTLTGTLCISDQVAFDATAASPTVANNNLGTFGGRFQIAGWNASLTAYRPYTGTAAGGSGKVTFSAEL